MSRDSSYNFVGTENFVIKNGIFQGVETPYLTEYTSYGELVLERLKANPKFVGQINGLTGEEETFSKMLERSVKCAMWLKEQNVQPGDVVGFCCGIHMDAYVVLFASLFSGTIFNGWWDAGLTKEIARHFLNLTQPKVLFTNEASARIALEVSQEIGKDVKIIVLGKLSGFQSLDDILATQDGKAVADFRCTKLASVDAPATLVYTSGTTGLPKAALHTHRSLFGNLGLAANLGASNNSAVTVLIFSSLSWITGLLIMLKAVVARETKVVHPECKEETILHLIERFKVNWVFLGTSLAIRLMKCPSIGQYDTSSLNFIFIGGAALKTDMERAMSDTFPHVTIHQAYGATELGGVGLQQSSDFRLGSCGRLVKNLSMKVIDPETGTILGPNQTGEACFKSPFMMSCYFNNPEATSRAIDSEGWYHTGDLVHYDEEGHVFITDRIKEMIKYRGQQVSPAMVEHVLQNHPGVSEAAVLGVPHEIDDEHAIAFVAKTAASNVTKEELQKLVDDVLPDYMKLRGGIMFLDQLPHTSSGKIARSSLRNLIKSYGR